MIPYAWFRAAAITLADPGPDPAPNALRSPCGKGEGFVRVVTTPCGIGTRTVSGQPAEEAPQAKLQAGESATGGGAGAPAGGEIDYIRHTRQDLQGERLQFGEENCLRQYLAGVGDQQPLGPDSGRLEQREIVFAVPGDLLCDPR